MRHGSLFAGIGGFDLGFERVGIETIWTVENDANCNRILAEHWPGVKRHSDVREVGRDNLEPVDVISGGFPCQDLSVAGRHAGLAGERSGLWWEFARIIEEMAPRWVVVENVPGLFSSQEGEDFLVIIEALDLLGYGVSWRVFDSQYFGVPQRRRRVFIVGSLGDMRSAEILFESEGGAGDSAESGEKGKRLATDVAAGLRSGGAGKRGWINDVEQGLVTAPVKAAPPSQCNAGSYPCPGDLIVFNWQSGGDVRLGISDERVAALHSSQTPAVAYGGNRTRGPIDVATACNAHGSRRYDFESETLLVGFDASRSGQDALENLSPTMTHKGDGPQAHSAFHKLSIAWDLQQITSKDNRSLPHEYAPTLNQAGQMMMGVRRLTPTECERLQGFPDGWTEGLSDSARYRCLGNAVTVNVAEWIGRRLAAIC